MVDCSDLPTPPTCLVAVDANLQEGLTHYLAASVEIQSAIISINAGDSTAATTSLNTALADVNAGTTLITAAGNGSKAAVC